MPLIRAEISAVYAGGVVAVIGVIEHPQVVAIAQQEHIAAVSARVKEPDDHVKTTRRASSKPPSSDGYQRRAS